MAMIKLENVNKYFGDLHVLKDVNLEVEEGEKLVIIGPSGSGKSTTVRCMNYLEAPSSGHVYIDGTELTAKNKTKVIRDSTSMVFQQFNLYPHMTVLKNLTLAPMKLHHKSKKEAEELAYHYLDIVGLKDKADVYPATLSGGQQQRIVRGGLNSVALGQLEAGQSQGFGMVQIMWYIVLPQAFRAIIPTLLSQVITTIKDSSFLANVAVIELMARTKQILSAANRYNGTNAINVSDVFVLFGTAALIYFVINFSISMVVRSMQKRRTAPVVRPKSSIVENKTEGVACLDNI